MSAPSFAGFVLAVLLLALAPGPATALVVRRSALRGTRAVFPLVAGIELGILAWAVAAAFGIAALVAASTTAFVVLKVVGAAVLVVLGVRTWRAARHVSSDTEAVPDDVRSHSTWRSFGLGALTNLANPKAAGFAFAFYPQFVPPGPNALRTTLVLAVVHVVVDASWYLVLATVVGKARGFFQRSKIRRRLERATGALLVALGLRLAVLRA